MSINVRAGGTSRPVTQVWVRAGGAWRSVQQVWVRAGGAWRQAFTSFTITGANYNAAFVGVATSPQISFNTDGTTAVVGGTNFNWGSPTTIVVGALYWINVTVGSGSGTMSGTFSTWLSLNTVRDFSMTAAPLGQSRLRNCTYQISTDSGGSTIVGSGSMHFSSDR